MFTDVKALAAVPAIPSGHLTRLQPIRRLPSLCERHTALMSVVNALGTKKLPFSRTEPCHDDRAWVEAELKDVGDQALMRGLVTVFPIVRPGLFRSYCGRRLALSAGRLGGGIVSLRRASADADTSTRSQQACVELDRYRP